MCVINGLTQDRLKNLLAGWSPKSRQRLCRRKMAMHSTVQLKDLCLRFGKVRISEESASHNNGTHALYFCSLSQLFVHIALFIVNSMFSNFVARVIHVTRSIVLNKCVQWPLWPFDHVDIQDICHILNRLDKYLRVPSSPFGHSSNVASPKCLLSRPNKTTLTLNKSVVCNRSRVFVLMLLLFEIVHKALVFLIVITGHRYYSEERDTIGWSVVVRKQFGGGR